MKFADDSASLSLLFGPNKIMARHYEIMLNGVMTPI